MFRYFLIFLSAHSLLHEQMPTKKGDSLGDCYMKMFSHGKMKFVTHLSRPVYRKKERKVIPVQSYLSPSYFYFHPSKILLYYIHEKKVICRVGLKKRNSCLCLFNFLYTALPTLDAITAFLRLLSFRNATSTLTRFFFSFHFSTKAR